MSLCDTCMSPGHCCKRLVLTGGEFNEPQSPEAAEHALLKRGMPMFRIGEEIEPGKYAFWCTALGPDGRCTIYDERPDLCRRYVAGSDGLCVHHWKED